MTFYVEGTDCRTWYYTVITMLLLQIWSTTLVFLMANGVLGVQQSLQLFRVPSFDHTIPASGMVFSDFDDIASVSQCSKSCFNRPGCVSIFFNSATKQCIAAGDLADHQMVSAPGFQHYTTHSPGTLFNINNKLS